MKTTVASFVAIGVLLGAPAAKAEELPSERYCQKVWIED
jgi:hypothetical protein